MDQKTFLEAIEDVKAAMNNLVAVISEQLAPITSDFMKAIIRISRDAFRAKLIEIGIPAGISKWIAEHWPERRLPLEWIFDARSHQ